MWLIGCDREQGLRDIAEIREEGARIKRNRRRREEQGLREIGGEESARIKRNRRRRESKDLWERERAEDNTNTIILYIVYII
jgi:hypothetical protein